ncbi:hypothetical protein RB595_003880 [Gaeumannomyces hyphopodioides]
MASQLKPLKPYGVGGPNPPKIIMALEELGIPYEAEPFPMDQVKSPEFLAINPNGRLPALQDPNTDLTVWESGAILEYLVERYDKDNKISFPAGSNEAALARQWLFFQVSGQGPYYGQAVYFTRAFSEKVPAVVERFVKEIIRVSGVLESHLSKQKGNVAEAGPEGEGPWLVGDRYTYADLSFFPWQHMIAMVQMDPDVKVIYDPNEFPNVKKWLGNLIARPAIAKGLALAL